MIFRPQRTARDRYPDMVLRCDGGAPCPERQTFPYSTTYTEIVTWARRHGWLVTHKGQGRFQHYCASCERLTKAPASYFERLSA